MPFYELILGSLAVWRLTHLIHAEDGPGEILARFRTKLRDTFWGKLVGCFYCLSLWVSAPAAVMLAQGWKDGVLLWLGLSGAAILLERATVKAAPAALFYEEPEVKRDGM